MNGKEYGAAGRICFDKLWELLEKKNLNKNYLRTHGIYANTVAKLIKDENVTCEVLAELCCLLDCKLSDIAEFKRI